MKILKYYLTSNRKSGIFFIVFFLVYLVTFWLFQFPISVILYSSLLCMVIGVFCIGWDFFGFWRRHKTLDRIARLQFFDIQQLPEPDSLWEDDYQKLIGKLIAEQNHLKLEKNNRFEDMINYYTLWVHQIKTPIASMRLMLQEEDSDFSRGLKMELLEVEQYVEMVLCYLRLDSESTDYVVREYDLDVIIRQEVKKLAPQFIRKKLQLEYGTLDSKVLSDEKWLGFIIGQVLSNAVKYTKEGTISITLEKPQILCICDTGIGIAREDLPRIFEKGFTGFNGRSDKKASGIGLYLCKRICDNLGHSISVDSEVDQGTRVCIDLGHRKLEME